MSNKNRKLKKKLRKLLHAQINQEEQKAQVNNSESISVPTFQPVDAQPPKKEKVFKKEKIDTKEIESIDTSSHNPEPTLTHYLNPFFKSDIKRIGLTVGSILILLFGITMLSAYTPIVSNFAETMFNFLHL